MSNTELKASCIFTEYRKTYIKSPIFLIAKYTSDRLFLREEDNLEYEEKVFCSSFNASNLAELFSLFYTYKSTYHEVIFIHRIQKSQNKQNR